MPKPIYIIGSPRWPLETVLAVENGSWQPSKPVVTQSPYPRPRGRPRIATSLPKSDVQGKNGGDDVRQP